MGETIFVFDYAAPELREMKAGFRILRQTDDGEDPVDTEAATTASLAPQIYPKGTFSFAHVFTQPGDFVGVVTVDGAAGEHWKARFPFSVGKRRFEISPYYLIAAAGLLALFLFVSSRKQADRPAALIASERHAAILSKTMKTTLSEREPPFTAPLK